MPWTFPAVVHDDIPSIVHYSQVRARATSCTATHGSAGFPVIPYDISKPAISKQLASHHRLHRFLIATGVATTSYAHDHIWTDKTIFNLLVINSKPVCYGENTYSFYRVSGVEIKLKGLKVGG